MQRNLSDLCSVIAMVAAEDDSIEMLQYCLSGTIKDVITWGHEYLRALAGQIGKEFPFPGLRPGAGKMF